MLRNLVIVVLLAGLGFGIYYFSCRYKADERIRAFDHASIGLRQDLLKMQKKVGDDDLRALVKRHAEATGVVVERMDLTLEPLTPENQARLPMQARKGLTIVAIIPGYRAPACIVGYHVWLAAKSGIVTRRGESWRFTPFDDVDPALCTPPEKKNEKVDWGKRR
ncbi:MAG: hypothetical protein JRH20_23825 [Deltaproteobacteria bacterium]|nr:hypothetical protein [Deltaproteobacteria bacterium]